MVYTCELFASILFVHNHFSPCSCLQRAVLYGEESLTRVTWHGDHRCYGRITEDNCRMRKCALQVSSTFGRFASAELGLKAWWAWLKYHQLHARDPTTRYHQSHSRRWRRPPIPL